MLTLNAWVILELYTNILVCLDKETIKVIDKKLIKNQKKTIKYKLKLLSSFQLLSYSLEKT